MELLGDGSLIAKRARNKEQGWGELPLPGEGIRVPLLVSFKGLLFSLLLGASNRSCSGCLNVGACTGDLKLSLLESSFTEL